MEGVQWSNIDEPIIHGTDNFTHLDSIKMLLVDVVINFTLIWYLDNVFPGEFGVPKPYLFFLTVRKRRVTGSIFQIPSGFRRLG